MSKVFEIPIIFEGKVMTLKIQTEVKVRGRTVVRKARILNADEFHICEEAQDIIIGSTTLYIKCGDSWKTFQHLIKNISDTDWGKFTKFLKDVVMENEV